MNAALVTLLANPAIWRGGDCAPEPATLPSGFAALDAALPGGGWPQGTLTEVLLEREGIGELRLMVPALARVQAQGLDVVWIAPPHRPYAPALVAAGIDLPRLYVVPCPDAHDAPWRFEHALPAPACGAGLAWLCPAHAHVLLRVHWA